MSDMDIPPQTPEPVAPVVPATPAPIPEPIPAPAPAPKRSRGATLSWFIGGLLPIIVAIAYFALASDPFWDVYDSSPILFYTGAALAVLLWVLFSPLLALGALGLGSIIAMSVAGYGLPSPVGILLVTGFWACVGRGVYALYRSRFRVLVWLLLAVALVAIAFVTYRNTATLRPLVEGDIASCDTVEPDYRNLCFHRAAVAAKDRTICERVSGYQRLTCIEDVVVPATPQECADIYSREPEVIPGGNTYEIYHCVANIAERTHTTSLCDLIPSPDDPNYGRTDWEYHRNDCIRRASAR